MTKLHKAAEQALRYLIRSRPSALDNFDEMAERHYVIEDLQEALAQQEEQPSQYGSKELQELIVQRAIEKSAPAAQPLTDEQIKHIYMCETGWSISDSDPMLVDFARAIERAHGIGADK